MANKRIRDLTVFGAPPPGALFPLDAASLSEAQAIALTVLGDALAPVLTPQGLVADDPTQATQNAAAITAKLDEYAFSGARRGILLLPHGVFWVEPAIVIAAKHSGLTVLAYGCTLLTNN